MASRYVTCRNLEHAEQLEEAGMLYLNFGIVGKGDDWTHCSKVLTKVRELWGSYDEMWPPSEFAYRLED